MKNKEKSKPAKAFIAPTTIRSTEQLAITIRRVRKLLNMSQGELALKAGITQATVSNLERGKSGAEIGTLLLIFAVLNLDMLMVARSKDSDDLLEGLF